ncbi:N-acetyl-gamma-glutamyl-phosphate reductase [Flaviflagellibacter deserti]|uniref:N-acetyl-gamma-glutamyl-phosphate reductase n=1 Tax=Flaviflagellibacter deserti TaxID=2267266 RepID=A0ABV9Z3K8_9HYPH
MAETVRVGVYGASGYTGSELLRILLRHPNVSISALTADRKAGQQMKDVFPQFTGVDLPVLTTITEVDPHKLDVVFCALPHGTTQHVVADLMMQRPELKIVDLSADFRLENPEEYARWYGHAHEALDQQKEAVYGLTELYREKIKGTRLLANPGCHSGTSIIPMVPLLKAGIVDADNIVIDSKTGMSGAGRGASEGMLFSEVAEGTHAYGVGKHRHTSELDQEFSKAAGRPVFASFTPHLLPMIRGIYATIYLRTLGGAKPEDLHRVLADAYAGETFIQILPFGQVPQSRHVKGSNNCQLGVIADRMDGRAIVISTTDNLMKGASGQAVQNFNLMCGFDEATALAGPALFP